MREVMMKAQELAEAILNSDIYQKMKTQEASVRHDPAAAAVRSPGMMECCWLSDTSRTRLMV